MRFYLDTSIWIDLYEDRKGYSGEKLGDIAWKLLNLIKENEFKLVISDVLIRELEVNYSIAEINGMIKIFEKNIEKVIATKEQHYESQKIAEKRNVPRGDVFHAVIARDNGLILITRDNHFRKLEDICPFHRPEEFI